MLDMKCAPKDGTVVVVCTQRGMWLANWSVSGWYGTAGCVRIDDEILGWWPIGNKWLDPKVVPPPRNQSFAGLVGTGVSGPTIVAWDIVRGEWYDHSTGSTVTLRGWLPLPDAALAEYEEATDAALAALRADMKGQGGGL